MSMSRLAGFIRPGYNPLKVPNPPTIGTPTAGNTQVSVAFTAPSDIGGGAISSYTAVSTPGGFSASAASSPIVVTGLTNGTAYTFTVLATNAYGPSAISAASSSVTPTPPSWIATLGEAPSGILDDFPYQIYIDTAKNVYVSGAAFTSSVQYPELTKYNSAGVIQWQYRFGSSSGQAVSVIADSSENIYLLSAQSSITKIYKLNSSGAIQWQKSLNVSNPVGLKIDNSGNLVVLFIGTNSNPYLASLDSTASTVNWVRTKTSSTGETYNNNCFAIAASGNIYTTGIEGFNPGYGASIIKFNSSGTLQWRKRAGGSSSAYGYGIAVDSSENVYMSMTRDGSPTSYVYKVDSAGTYIWSVTIAGTYGGTVGIDSTSTYIYITGQVQSGGKQYIIKLDTSGTVQWQRTIANVGAGGQANMQSPYGPPVIDSTFMYIPIPTNAGYSYGNIDWIMEKLPVDGSKTGTYTVGSFTLTYATSSLTIGSGTSDLSTGDFASSAGSVTISTPTDTATATTIATSTTTL